MSMQPPMNPAVMQAALQKIRAQQGVLLQGQMGPQDDSEQVPTSPNQLPPPVPAAPVSPNLTAPQPMPQAPAPISPAPQAPSMQQNPLAPVAAPQPSMQQQAFHGALQSMSKSPKPLPIAMSTTPDESPVVDAADNVTDNSPQNEQDAVALVEDEDSRDNSSKSPSRSNNPVSGMNYP